MGKEQSENEIVIILHGIGHNQWNMVFLEWFLKRKGYRTLNLTYPSRKQGIQELASWLNLKLNTKQVWEGYNAVHFVGHSMGGLVIDRYLNIFKSGPMQNKMGRVVMLGTPHGGSEVADYLHQNLLYKFVFGPAGQELTTRARLESRVYPWYELGIIAGRRNWGYPLGWMCIKTEHDGCVSVESTKLEGMKDHITLSVMHGLMSWNGKVYKQVACFIQKGMFSHCTIEEK